MRNMKKMFTKVAAFSMAAMMAVPMVDFGSLSGTVEAKAATSQGKQIKNIIYMIPDGGGYPLYDIAAAVKEAGGLKSSYTSSFTGTKIDSSNSKMYLKDYLVGSSQTWTVDNSASVVTDSPAGGTALACGHRTKKGYVGISSDKKPMASILELAQLEGKATGMAVTCPIYDATPGDFCANTTARKNYSDILSQIEYKRLNVVMGAAVEYKENGMSSDNEEKIAEMGYEVVRTEDELKKAAAKATEDSHIWASFMAESHHIAYDYKYGSSYDGVTDNGKTPTLAEMTESAIDILEEDEDGFFLMVEGSKIDYAGHHANTLEVASEYIAFDEAFKVALDYAKKRQDTMIVVVADHNTGITETPSSSKMSEVVKNAQNGKMYDKTQLKLTGSPTDSSIDHSADNVGVYMYLPDGVGGMSKLSSTTITDSSKRNNYVVRNEEIPQYLATLISDKSLDDATKELYIDVTKYSKVGSGYATITGLYGSAKAYFNQDIIEINGKKQSVEGKLTICIDSKVYISRELANLLGINSGKTLDGKGTQSDPYVIKNEDDMVLFTNMMKAGETFSGKYIKQTTNLDMTKIRTYAGIGSEGTFEGTYDGQGYRINVDITANVSTGIAVFPYTKGTIMNLGTTGQITNTNTGSDENGCGGIVRSVRAGGKVINCYSTVDLKSENGCGGITWTIKDDATVVNCYYKGKIVAPSNYAIGNISTGSIVNRCYYELENGSSSLAATNFSGEKVKDGGFKASVLNGYEKAAVSEISSLTTTEQLCNFADVEGEDFAFEGSIARLSSLGYSYTDNKGNEVVVYIEDFDPTITGYSINLPENAKTTKIVKFHGTGAASNINSEVVSTDGYANEYGFITGSVDVTAKVSNNYYTTTSSTNYGLSGTGPIPTYELEAEISTSAENVAEGSNASVNVNAKGGKGDYTYTIYSCDENKSNAKIVSNKASYSFEANTCGTTYYFAKVSDGENTVETDVVKIVVSEVNFGDLRVEYNGLNYDGQTLGTPKHNSQLLGGNNDNAAFSCLNITTPGNVDGVFYRAYDGEKWNEWMSDGEYMKKDIKAIQIKLSETLAKSYDIYYRTMDTKNGVHGWVCNGANSGSILADATGIEGIQVVIFKKGTAPSEIANDTVEGCMEENYIYFVTSSWSTPYIYMWNSSSDKNAAWPGVKMEKVEGESGLWRYKIEGSATKYKKCIFNNGSSTTKTDDLECPGAGYKYYRYEARWEAVGNVVQEKNTVIAKYVDEEGNLLSKEVFSGFDGEDYVTTAKSIDGYTLKSIKGVETGKYIYQVDVVRYVYGKSLVSKWVNVAGKWYYYNAIGELQTGWAKIGAKWYYFSSTGIMQTGWQKLSNKWYYLSTSGVMLTGWQKINNKWYYMDSNGVMQANRWISGVYYVKADGSMAVSEWVDGGKYYVDASGKWVKGAVK